MKFYVKFLLFLCFFIQPCQATEIFQIMKVFDGDTVKLRNAQGEFKLRLADIDAPERTQAYGQKSRRALTKLCKNQNILITAMIVGIDKYQRSLGYLQCNNIDAGLYLVEQGLAWHNAPYSNNPITYKAELSARQQKIGLWKSTRPTPPWVWRHTHHHYNQQ